MNNFNNRIDLKEYKGVLIQYTCEECQVYDQSFEVFDNQNSRIKSGDCFHFNLKFIYKYQGGNFKYIVSFNCSNCDQKDIFILFDENSNEIVSNKEIKCKNCNKGSMYILLLLSKDNPNEEMQDNNNREQKSVEDIEESKDNNAPKKKIFITPQEINLIFKDFKGNSYSLYISSNELLSKAIRILINKYKIDVETISEFFFGEKKLDVKKTLIENNLQNDSIIIIHYNN